MITGLGRIRVRRSGGKVQPITVWLILISPPKWKSTFKLVGSFGQLVVEETAGRLRSREVWLFSSLLFSGLHPWNVPSKLTQLSAFLASRVLSFWPVACFEVSASRALSVWIISFSALFLFIWFYSGSFHLLQCSQSTSIIITLTVPSIIFIDCRFDCYWMLSMTSWSSDLRGVFQGWKDPFWENEGLQMRDWLMNDSFYCLPLTEELLLHQLFLWFWLTNVCVCWFLQSFLGGFDHWQQPQ